jgi:hypothetical protein
MNVALPFSARLAAAASLSLAMAACSMTTATLVAPKDNAKVAISGIDVEIFQTGVGAPPIAQGKQGKDFYVPEQKLIERIAPKLIAAGIPARAQLVSTLPGDPVPTPDQVFGATPANEVLVLSKIKAETVCMQVCGTSTWYHVSLQDRDSGTERWAARMHLGSNDRGIEGNMRAMDSFLSQIVVELQKVVAVKS